jgi:hypothetical protein
MDWWAIEMKILFRSFPDFFKSQIYAQSNSVDTSFINGIGKGCISGGLVLGIPHYPSPIPHLIPDKDYICQPKYRDTGQAIFRF